MKQLDKWAEEDYWRRKPGTFELPLDYCTGYRQGFLMARKMIAAHINSLPLEGEPKGGLKKVYVDDIFVKLMKEDYNFINTLGDKEVRDGENKTSSKLEEVSTRRAGQEVQGGSPAGSAPTNIRKER